MNTKWPGLTHHMPFSFGDKESKCEARLRWPCAGQTSSCKGRQCPEPSQTTGEEWKGNSEKQIMKHPWGVIALSAAFVSLLIFLPIVNRSLSLLCGSPCQGPRGAKSGLRKRYRFCPTYQSIMEMGTLPSFFTKIHFSFLV